MFKRCCFKSGWNYRYLSNRKDVYLNKYQELIVSEKALNVLKNHALNNCEIEEEL